MGLRFRKIFRIAPGLRINAGLTGISESIGPRGARLNLRGGRLRATISALGTGLSYTKQAQVGWPGALFILAAILMLFAAVFF